MNDYYVRHYKHVKVKNDDWFISVDTTSGSQKGGWSVEYVYEAPPENEMLLEDDLFEI